MEKNITALFEVNVPKTAKTLAKFVSKDTLRPQYLYICIEPGRGFMTATDMSELRVINIEAAGEWQEGARILVDPKHIAKIAGKTATVTVSEFDNHRSVEIEADGENYVTEYKRMNYPDVMRVIPPKENRPAIRLTAESVEALKTICKISKANNYITLATVEGDNRIIVCNEVKDYSENRAAYNIELAEPAEKSSTISLNPVLLSDCLTGSNGVILVDEPYKPVMFEGDADATILMPMCVNDRDAEFVGKVRDNSILAASTFAEDVKEVAAKLRDAAAELWQSICRFNDRGNLIPGNYTAKDIANRGKAKCGYYLFPDFADYAFELEVKHGNISLKLDYSELFSILAVWESVVKCPKMTFKLGEVEEVTATVLEATDDGAAEKKIKLRKLGGNWYCDTKRGAKDYDVLVYYQINGVIFSICRVFWSTIDDAEKWQAWINSREGQVEKLLRAQASTHNKYYSEVLKRVEAQQPATTAEMPQIVKVEIVRDFDGSYYANLFDNDGKYHTLSDEYVSYNKLKSLCRAEYGIELPNRAALNFKQYGRKEFAYYTPQSTEMPQISTETAEAVNVSAEKKNEPETAKYRFTQNEIDEMKQDILGACEFNATALEKGYKKVFPEMGEYSALNIRRSHEGYINEFEEGSKNRKFYERRLALYESLTENDRPNFTQQTPPEPIKEPEHLSQPPKNAPRSHKVFPTANYTTLTPKTRGNARKQLCRRLGANGYVMLDEAAATLAAINTLQHLTANSPPTGRPQLTPYW